MGFRRLGGGDSIEETERANATDRDNACSCCDANWLSLSTPFSEDIRANRLPSLYIELKLTAIQKLSDMD